MTKGLPSPRRYPKEGDSRASAARHLLRQTKLLVNHRYTIEHVLSLHRGAGRNISHMKDDLWIVVPAFNEGSQIARTLAQLSSYLPNVVVVDDGSTDSTGEEARRAGASVVRHAINLGQGAGLITGI